MLYSFQLMDLHYTLMFTFLFKSFICRKQDLNNEHNLNKPWQNLDKTLWTWTGSLIFHFTYAVYEIWRHIWRHIWKWYISNKSGWWFNFGCNDGCVHVVILWFTYVHYIHYLHFGGWIFWFVYVQYLHFDGWIWSDYKETCQPCSWRRISCSLLSSSKRASKTFSYSGSSSMSLSFTKIRLSSSLLLKSPAKISTNWC